MASLESQRVMEIMADATNTIAEGEVLQLMNAHDPETTEQRYLEVIYRKTARLFEAGAEVAAVLAGTPPRFSARSRTMAGIWVRRISWSMTCWIIARPGGRGKNLGDDLADAFWSWLGRLAHTIRTGESSVPGIEGVSSFEYLHRHPEKTRRFNRMMSEMIGAMAKGMLSAYDFSAFNTVVDVGGGRGTLLATILEAYPRLRGVLFDLPATADEARDAIAARGLAERCECIGGDFFGAVPAGDCIMLSAVISDWDDEKSVAILASCRRAIAPQGRLLLLERLLVPEEPAPQGAFMDLQMLVIGGGTGRSADEYRRLLHVTGFELARVVPTGTARSIFESRPM